MQTQWRKRVLSRKLKPNPLFRSRHNLWKESIKEYTTFHLTSCSLPSNLIIYKGERLKKKKKPCVLRVF